MERDCVCESELTILCEQFLVHIKNLYNQGLINSNQFQEMSKIKIEYLEYVKNR